MAAPPRAAPPLVSEHGKGGGFITVKAHTRAAPKKVGIPDLTPAAAARVAATPKKKAAPVPTQRSAPTDVVGSEVTAAQLPAIQAINAAQAASKTAAANAATTTTGYYGALADILKGVGPATQAGYQSSAADTSAFAKGISDGMAHIQAQNDATSANVAGISGGAAPAPAGPGAANALYAAGGLIPAEGLEREGAAFGAAANMQPATAAGQGAASIQGINAQQAVDQQGFTKQLSDLAAQVPGLRLQYQGQYDTQQNALANQRQAALNATNLENDRAIQRQLSYIAATGVDPRTGKLTPKAQLDWNRVMGGLAVSKTNAVTAQGRLAVAKVNAQNAATRLTLAQQKQISDMYGHDAAGNLTLPGQKAALAEYKATHPAAKGGFTKSQLAKIATTATTMADNFRHGKQVFMKDPSNPAGPMVTDTAKSIYSNPDYQSVLKLMLAQNIPLSIAQKALNLYWPLGNAGQGHKDAQGNELPYGRPYLSVQERQALGGAIDPFKPPTQTQVNALRARGFNYAGPITPTPTPDTGFRQAQIP